LHLFLIFWLHREKIGAAYSCFRNCAEQEQRWAKVTTLRAFTIFSEALFQLKKRGWESGLVHELRKEVKILFSIFLNMNFKTFILERHHFLSYSI
jgi:hypothetical protein